MNKIIFFTYILSLLIPINAEEGLKRDYAFLRRICGGWEIDDIHPLDDKENWDDIYENMFCIDHFYKNFSYNKEKILDPLPNIDKRLLFLLPADLKHGKCSYSFNCERFYEGKEDLKFKPKMCPNAVHYQGYLDPDFKRFNHQLEDMLLYYDQTEKQCTCFWPEYSSSAAKISDLAYVLFEDLFSNSALSIFISNKYLQSNIIGNHFWNLNLHGLSVSVVCQSFWFSHYYQMCQMLLEFSSNAKAFSAKDEKRIKAKIDNILWTLAEEFEEVYTECLQKHPSSTISGELAFLQGLLNFSSDRKHSKHVAHGIELNEFNLTSIPLEFETIPPKSKGEKLESSENNFYLSSGYTLKSENFLSEFCLVQGLLYNDLLQYPQAIECLSKAISHDRNNGKAYLARAYAYFEIQEMDQAIADYRRACEHNIIPPFKNPQTKIAFLNIQTSISDHVEFSKGLAIGIMQGFNEGAEEFTPSAILSTLTGIGQGLWHFVKEPYTITHEFATTIIACVQEIIEHLTPEQMEKLAPEIKEMVIRWHSIGFFEQGRVVGHIIGKYGVDIFACTGTVKIVQAYREVKYANASLTLSALTRSEARKSVIIKEAKRRAEARKLLFKDGKVKIEWDDQNKHILGSHNFDSDRGRIKLQKARLEYLLEEKVATGQPVPTGRIFGEPGYKERIDFGEIIGDYIYKVDGELFSEPTTMGIVHYNKKGFIHVTPARPKK